MIREAERVFVDSGAWIALAVIGDPYHDRARPIWDQLLGAGARLVTSVPVVLETFTFLDRNTTRDVALRWRASLDELPRLEILACSSDDLTAAWAYFTRSDLHRLSAVDASSFALMTRDGIRRAFAFDHRFATVGFKLVG